MRYENLTEEQKQAVLEEMYRELKKQRNQRFWCSEEMDTLVSNLGDLRTENIWPVNGVSPEEFDLYCKYRDDKGAWNPSSNGWQAFKPQQKRSFANLEPQEQLCFLEYSYCTIKDIREDSELSKSGKTLRKQVRFDQSWQGAKESYFAYRELRSNDAPSIEGWQRFKYEQAREAEQQPQKKNFADLSIQDQLCFLEYSYCTINGIREDSGLFERGSAINKETRIHLDRTWLPTKERYFSFRNTQRGNKQDLNAGAGVQRHEQSVKREVTELSPADQLRFLEYSYCSIKGIIGDRELFESGKALKEGKQVTLGNGSKWLPLKNSYFSYRKQLGSNEAPSVEGWEDFQRVAERSQQVLMNVGDLGEEKAAKWQTEVTPKLTGALSEFSAFKKRFVKRFNKKAHHDEDKSFDIKNPSHCEALKNAWQKELQKVSELDEKEQRRKAKGKEPEDKPYNSRRTRGNAKSRLVGMPSRRA